MSRSKNSRVLTVLARTTLFLLCGSAYASNGQCIWEGGPGAPTYPECSTEDCTDTGGLVKCTSLQLEPEFAVHDGQDFTYTLCPGNYVSEEAAMCIAAGGTWGGPTSCVLPDPCEEGIGNSNCDEAHADKTLDNYTIPAASQLCGDVKITETDWGVNDSSWDDQCSPTQSYTSYNIDTVDRKDRTYTFAVKPACTSESVMQPLGRYREVACPSGYDLRTLPNGDGQCYQPPPSTCCLVGNAVALPNSMELRKETDFTDRRSEGLEFTRTYNSQGFYQPDTAAPRASVSSDYWRNNFSKHLLIAVAPATANLLATAIDGEGVVTFYNPSGNEVQGFGGPQSHLSVNGTGWKIVLPNNDTEYYNANGLLTQIMHRGGARLILAYSTGLLATVTDQTGRALKFSYTNGVLKTMTDPAGGVYTYAYDPLTGALTSVTYPDTTVKTYLYEDSSNPFNLTGITDENSNRYATYSYQGNGVMGSEYLGTGADSRQYIPDGSEVTVWNPAGGYTNYSYTEINGTMRPSGVSVNSWDGSTGEQSATQYDPNGNPARSYEESSTAGTYNTTTYQYDPTRSLELARTEGLDSNYSATNATRTIKTVWHPTFNFPSTITTLTGTGQQTVGIKKFTYNSRAQVLAETLTDPVTKLTRTTTNAYCEAADVAASGSTCPIVGLLKSVTGPDGGVTSYAYYPASAAACTTAPTTCSYRLGDLNTVTNPLGQVTTYLTYDGAGRPLTTTDANGVETVMTYSPRGWLTQSVVLGPGNSATGEHVTTYSYDKAGQLQRLTQPDGSYVVYTYDGAHRLTDITDNLNNTIHLTLNNAGQRTAEATGPLNGTPTKTLSRVYNEADQLVTVDNADGSMREQFATAPNGNVGTVTDGLQHVTNANFDTLDRVVSTVQDPTGLAVNTNYAYDAFDRLTLVKDPQGLNTTSTYDGLGNLSTLTSPDTGLTQYTSYDAAGNLLSRTDANKVVSNYSYDARNRLTGIAYPATPTLNVTFTYDTTQTACNQTTEIFSTGKLTSIKNASGTTMLCYDRFGRMAYKHENINGVAFTTGYTFDLAGRLSQITTPKTTLIKYTRDKAGRITGITYRLAGQTTDTPVVSKVTYYPFGPVASITYGSGANQRTLTRSYDQDYVIQGLLDPGVAGANPGLNMSLKRDAIGNPKQMSWTSGTSTSVNNYLYDSLNRLTNVNDANNALIAAYQYDGTGNRTSKQVGGTTVQYTYPPLSHQLASVGSTPRTYDADGNTKTIGSTLGFVYDGTNRMSQSTGSGVTAYSYNGRGQRVEKLPAGNTAQNQYTVYDETGKPIGDYDYVAASKTTASIRELIWLDNLPVGVLSGSPVALAYIEPDQLGTPRVAIDSGSNAPVWTWSPANDPFGESAPVGSAGFVLNQRLPGQVWDAETGLDFNYFRDYDASTGRYIESDPLGTRGGVSTYSYVVDQPLSYIDPFGLIRWNGAAEINTVGIAKVGVGYSLVEGTFSLKSDCVGGRQATVVVEVKGSGWGAGISILPFGSFGTSTVQFDDPVHGHVDPSVFNGGFNMLAVDGGLGGTYSWLDEFKLGSAVGNGRGWGAATDVIAAFGASGNSTVTHQKITCCKGIY